MHRTFYWFVIALAITANAVCAWEFISTNTELYVEDNEAYNRRTLTFRCDREDFGENRTFQINNADGTISDVRVVCLYPRDTYYMELIGYVYPYARFFAQTFCQAQAVKFEIHPDFVAQAAASPRMRKLMSFGSFVKSAFGKVACMNPPYNALSGKCGGGGGDGWKAPFEEFKALVQDQLNGPNGINATLQAQIAWRASLENTLNATGATLENLVAADELIAETLNVTNARINNIDTRMGETTETLTRFMSAAGQDIQNIYDTQDVLTSSLQDINTDIGALVESTSEGLQNLTKQLNLVAMDTHTQMKAGFAAIEKRLATMLTTQYATASTIQQLSISFIREIAGYAWRRGLTPLVRHAIVTAEDDPDYTGMFLQPFLSDIGDAAADPVSVDMAWKFPLSHTRIMYVTTGAALVREYNYVIMCSTRAFVDSGTVSSTYLEIFGNVGPVGCDYSSHSTLTCVCWVEYRTHHCSTSTVKIAASSFSTDDAPIVNRSSDICTGAVTSSAVTVVTDLSVLLGLLDEPCTGGVYTTSPNNKYIVVSDTTGYKVQADYVSGVCASLDTLLTRDLNTNDAVSAHSYLYSMLRFIEIAMTSWQAQYGRLLTILDGELPQRLSFREQPLVRMFSDIDDVFSVIQNVSNALHEGRCMESSFVAFSDPLEVPMVPVYRIHLMDTIAEVNVTIGAGETETYSTSVTYIDASTAIRPDGRLVIGDITEATYAYDTPFELVQAGPAPTRGDTPTYALTPPNATHPDEPIPLTPEAFLDREGQHFDHTLAQISPDIYYIEKELNGRCVVGDRQPYHGRICDFLNSYTVTPSSPINITSVTTAARYFESSPSELGTLPVKYIATITIPDGEIVNPFVSACPISQLEETAADGMTLRLSNARSSGGAIYYRVERMGDCCSTVDTGLVTPGETTLIWMPLCLDTDPLCTTGESYLNVTRQTFSTPALADCAILNYTLSPVAFINRTGMATTSNVNRVSLTDRDIVSEAVYRAFDSTIRTQYGILMSMLETFVTIGIPVPVQLFYDVSTLLESNRNQSVVLGEVVDRNRNRTINDYEGWADSFNDTMGTLQFEFNNLTYDFEQRFAALQAQVNLSFNALDLYQLASTLFANATRLLNDRETAYAHVQIAAWNHLVTAIEAVGNSGGDIECNGSLFCMVGGITGAIDLALGPIDELVAEYGDDFVDSPIWGKVGGFAERLYEKMEDLAEKANPLKNLFGLGAGITEAIKYIIIIIICLLLAFGMVKFMMRKKGKDGGGGGGGGISEERVRQIVGEMMAAQRMQSAYTQMPQPMVSQVRPTMPPPQQQPVRQVQPTPKAQPTQQARTSFNNVPEDDERAPLIDTPAMI
jgi:hypothetical protein